MLCWGIGFQKEISRTNVIRLVSFVFDINNQEPWNCSMFARFGWENKVRSTVYEFELQYIFFLSLGTGEIYWPCTETVMPEKFP